VDPGRGGQGRPGNFMRNIRLSIEYDGTAYRGWQRQPDGPSIQGTLEEAIGKMTGETVAVIGAGRTDSGVHALGQVANFRTETRIPAENLHKGLNSILPPDIAVRDIADADPSFHARYDARRKVYFYRMIHRPWRPALLRNYAWHLRGPLSLSRMEEGASRFVGTLDFTSFCATQCDTRGRTRTVFRSFLTSGGDGEIRYTIEADGFLRHMVRNLVGTLVEIGRGRFSPGNIPEILDARDRRRAGATAPPQGLFLKEVIYE